MARTGAVWTAEGDSANATRLIVIRGNSASGKSAVAAEIRRRHGRGLAIVGLTDRICEYGCPDLRFHVTGMFMT
jgi:cytidylate kinase